MVELVEGVEGVYDPDAKNFDPVGSPNRKSAILAVRFWGHSSVG